MKRSTVGLIVTFAVIWIGIVFFADPARFLMFGHQQDDLDAIIFRKKKLAGASSSAPTSNILIVQTATNFGSGNYTVTISSSAGSTALIVVERDQGSTSAPTAPTDTKGDTFTVLHVASTHYSVSYTCNAASGNTAVNIKPASGADSSAVTEVSGLSSSSCEDAISSTTTVNGTNTNWGSTPLQAAQTDLAISFVGDGANATNKYTCGLDWTHLKFAPETTDGDTLDTCYIKNGVKSQFTSLGSISTSTASDSGLVLFKSAVAGTAPSGIQPSFYIQGDCGTDGTTLTTALLLPCMHGFSGITTPALSDYTGLTFSNAAGINPRQQVNVNGQSFTTSARGFAYDLTKNGANANEVQMNALVAYANTVSLAADINFPSGEAASTYNLQAMSGGGSADYLSPEIQTYGSVTGVSSAGTATFSGSWPTASASYPVGTVFQVAGCTGGSGFNGTSFTVVTSSTSTITSSADGSTGTGTGCTMTGFSVETSTTNAPNIAMEAFIGGWFHETFQYINTSGNFIIAAYNQSTGSQYGSNSSVARSGTSAATKLAWGRTGSEGSGSGSYYTDNLSVDGLNGTFPLGQ